MMRVGSIAVGMVAWAAIGYSLAFDERQRVHRRAGSHAAAGRDARAARGPIPPPLFMAFQATFCIIAITFISGAVVERLRFGAFLIFARL
jgi:Amt family ammonium transporter